MKTVKQLTEERGVILEKMNTIVDNAKSEARELTSEEAQNFDSMTEQAEALQSSITRAAKAEALKAEAAKKATTLSKEEGEAKRNYSLFRAINGLMNGNMNGLEAEIQAEAEKESRSGLQGIGIPTWMTEKRDYVDQATSAIAPVAIQAYADALRDGTLYDKVGVNDLGSLAANTVVPITGAITAGWAEENGDGTESSVDFGKVELTPKRVNAFSNVSRVLLAQNGPAAEAAVMRELGKAVGTQIDAALFGSTDVTNALPSIAGTTGVLTFTESTTAGGAGFVSDIVTAEQTLADDHGLSGNLAYVCNYILLTAAKTQAQVASVSPFYSELNGQGFANGHKIFFSAQPASVAATSGDCLFGDFSRVYFASFGPLDILVDPYSVATNNAVRLVLNHHYDAGLASGASFVKFTSLV
jgi:HK97 family phage major capsid protein